MDKQKLVPVYYSSGKLAGDMVKLMLESFGIQATIVQESIGQTYGLTAGPLGEVTILVPEDQVVDAQAILASMDEGELESPDTLMDGSTNGDTE